jgi:hypothetical protein
MTWKGMVLVAVPRGVVTLIGPLVALLGTVAVICALDLTANEADLPLKVTAVAPVKPEPVIVTLVPTRPPVGANEQIRGLIRAWDVPPG